MLSKLISELIAEVKAELHAVIRDTKHQKPEDRPNYWRERKRLARELDFLEWVQENGLEAEWEEDLRLTLTMPIAGVTSP